MPKMGFRISHSHEIKCVYDLKTAIVEYYHELALPNKSIKKERKTHLFLTLLSFKTEIGIYEKRFAFGMIICILLFEWF